MAPNFEYDKNYANRHEVEDLGNLANKRDRREIRLYKCSKKCPKAASFQLDACCRGMEDIGASGVEAFAAARQQPLRQVASTRTLCGIFRRSSRFGT